MSGKTKDRVDYITFQLYIENSPGKYQKTELWTWLHKGPFHIQFYLHLVSLLTQNWGLFKLDETGWNALLDTGFQDVLLSREEAESMIEELASIGYLDGEIYKAGALWSPEFSSLACRHISNPNNKKLWRTVPSADDIQNGKSIIRSGNREKQDNQSAAESYRTGRPMITKRHVIKTTERKSTERVKSDGMEDRYLKAMMGKLDRLNNPDETKKPAYMRPTMEIKQADGLVITDEYRRSRRHTIYEENGLEVAVINDAAYQEILDAVGGDEKVVEKYAKEIYGWCVRHGLQRYLMPELETWDGHEMVHYYKRWNKDKVAIKNLIDFQM